MNSQAVDELMEYGIPQSDAELIAQAEHDGMGWDIEAGALITLDPDAPIEYEPTQAGQDCAKGSE